MSDHPLLVHAAFYVKFDHFVFNGVGLLLYEMVP